MTALVSSVWYFRDQFNSDALPGDAGDGRWSVALTEHWFSVFRGQSSVRDVGFFFPVDVTLGMSDGFLVPGLIHSFARTTGAGIVDAWLLSICGVYLIGSLGLAALSKALFDTTAARIGFVSTSCLSYPIVIQEGHVQLLATLTWSWIVLAMIRIWQRRGGRWSAPTILLGLPLMALTAWYPFVLGLAVTIVFGVVALTMFGDRTLVICGAAEFRRLRKWASRPAGAATVFASTLLWILGAWIYLPAQRLLPARLWDEVALYSPRWSDLINAADRGGGVWAPLYDRMYPTEAIFNGEQPLGVTPLLMLAFALCSAMTLRRLLARNIALDARWRTMLIAALSVVGVWTTIVVDDRALGLSRLVFNLVPGAGSIRAPFRVQILLYPVILYVVIAFLEIVLRRGSAVWAARRAAIALLAVCGLFLVEMSRPTYSRWTRDDLVPTELVNLAGEVRTSCDSFVLDIDLPFASIDAVILAALTGVPTVNGHSSASPIGHSSAVEAGVPSVATDAWLRRRDFVGTLCMVSRSGLATIEYRG